MVFAHIHYNRSLELCAILFLLISFFCHKNMHLQKSVQLLGCISFVEVYAFCGNDFDAIPQIDSVAGTGDYCGKFRSGFGKNV